MSKKIVILISVLLALILAIGCTRGIKELDQLDESEFYIYIDGEFAFTGAENASELAYTGYYQGNFLVKYSDNDAGLETKRGIKIGSDLNELIKAYQGYFCFGSDFSSTKHLTSKALKYHEICKYVEYQQTNSHLPFYEFADYAVEFDVFMIEDRQLDYSELNRILKEQGRTFRDFLFEFEDESPISRRYIRFYVRNDEVVDIWIYYKK